MLRETGDHMPESSRRCRTRPPTKGEEVPRGGQLCNCNPVWAKSYTVGCIMLGNKTGCRYQKSGASGVSQRVFGDSSSPSLVSSGKETEFLAARMAERVGEELEDRFPEHAQEMRTADHRAQALYSMFNFLPTSSQIKKVPQPVRKLLPPHLLLLLSSRALQT